MNRSGSARLELRQFGRRIAAALCMCCSLLLAVAPGPTQAAEAADESSAEERAKVRVFEALDLMDAGSYGEARLMLQLALGLNSELDRAWYYLAQCNVELKNWTEALEALSKYESANLSEHERMQIANLRGEIKEQQAAAAAEYEDGEEDEEYDYDDDDDYDEGQGEWESEDEDRPAKTTEPASDSKAEAAAEAAATPGGVPAAVGPTMLILGGIVAGVGAGAVIGSIVQANAAVVAGDEQALKAGETPYGVGMGALIGGGVVFAIGIPLSIAGKKAPTKMAISFAADAVQPGAAVYLVGRW